MKTRRSLHQRWAALLLTVLSGAAGMAQAQHAAGIPPEAQQRLAEAKQRLQLTPEQETSLRALLLEEATKLRAIREKYANDTSLQARGARSREMRAVQEDFHTRLQGVLSPAQLDEWERMAAERRAQARDRRLPPQPPKQ
ncbi:MAG TPA: hypothetical protein VML58_09975 [Burkholderiaceae bacterium]|nr:hypothetical protein [Burkholderiaceae bacterium]